MPKLGNEGRNAEVYDAIGQLKDADPGPLADKKSGIATALSNLDLAESVQLLQLQVMDASVENRRSLNQITDKIIESNIKLSQSNDRHAKAMKWLTAALVTISLVQVILNFIQHRQ